MFESQINHREISLVQGHEAPALDIYFSETSALGTYSTIEVSIDDSSKTQIVVDQHMAWLEESLKVFFKEIVTRLSMKQITDYLTWLRNNSRMQFSLATFLGLAPHKDIENTNILKVFYLDDITHNQSQKSLILSLVAQTLIEKYTQRESRVVKIEEKYEDKSHSGYMVLIRSQISGYQVLDSALEFKNIGHHIFYSMNEKTTHQGSPVLWTIKKNEFRVLRSDSVYDDKAKTFSIVSGRGNELNFSILGRTPAEKRFKAEEQQIRSASPDDLVPIEIAFHPFWRRLGHTTLRIGESLYELSSKGWKVYGSQGSSARAYLFNNPFFKEQYKRYSPSGMSPTSIGVTMLAPKYKVDQLQVTVQNLVSAQGKEREKFNLYWNNCNQGIMRVLSEVGFEGFSDKGYHGFSSVLSFRQILIDPPLPRIGIYLYPLPGTEISGANIRKWIPKLLYRHNSTRQEVARALPSLYWDAVVFWGKKTSDVIYRFTKLRLWKGHDGYQYLNT